MHSKMEVVACRTTKINTKFIAAVFVHVPKYVFGQHLYEQADACTAKWKLWSARLKNKYYVYNCYVYSCSITCISNGFLFLAR